MNNFSKAVNIQSEVDDDLLNLSQFGVCRSENAGTLVELGYLTGSSKWFKPVVGALNYFDLTANAKERILALNIDALDFPSALPERVDLFSEVEWTIDNYNSLIFTALRIMTEIVKGNSEQIAKSSLGDTWMHAKLGREGQRPTSDVAANSGGE